MTVSGAFDAWASCFPDECLPELFRTIVNEWPAFRRSSRQLENRITHNFVAHLQRSTRWRVPFSFSYRDKLTSKEKDTEEGEVDITVRTGIDPMVFFGFECKRLNVKGKDGVIRSGAGAYVGPEGMGCFLTGKYDGGGFNGGMIGYVLDDDLRRARSSVDDLIFLKRQSLKSHPPYRLCSAKALFSECRGLEQTTHDYEDAKFTIFHLFLPINPENN